MASRTKQKEEARARRLAEERARAERAQRTKRVRMLGGVVIAAVVVIVIAIVISTSGGSSDVAGPPPTSAAGKVQAANVNSLLAGIPQSGETLGYPSAKVTMIEYGDLECPICRDFALTGENQLIAHDVRSGKLKLVFKSFETATGDPGATRNIFSTQQAAAYAAGLQGKAWNYLLIFYHEQGQENTGYVTPTFLAQIANEIPGLNYGQWFSQYTSSSLASQVNSENRTARAANYQGTPTIILQGPKGQTQAASGDIPYGDIEAGIKAVS